MSIITIPPDLTVDNWGNILNLKLGDSGETVLTRVADAYKGIEMASLDESRSLGSFPPDEGGEVTFYDLSGNQLVITVYCRWKKYKAVLKASLMDGSYCLNDGSFRGTQYGPIIDLQGEHPGDSWEELIEAGFQLPSNRIIAMVYAGNIEQALAESLGTRPINLRSEA